MAKTVTPPSKPHLSASPLLRWSEIQHSTPSKDNVQWGQTSIHCKTKVRVWSHLPLSNTFTFSLSFLARDTYRSEICVFPSSLMYLCCQCFRKTSRMSSIIVNWLNNTTLSPWKGQSKAKILEHVNYELQKFFIGANIWFYFHWTPVFQNKRLSWNSSSQDWLPLKILYPVFLLH